MKKRLTIIAVLLVLCSTMFGQSTPQHPWGDVVNGFEETRRIRGFVSIYGEQQQYNVEDNIVVGAFCGEQLRGVSELSSQTNKFSFNIGGLSNDLITFAVYIPSTGEVLFSDYGVTFKKISSPLLNKDLNFLYHWNHADFNYRDYLEQMMFTNTAVTIDGDAVESNLFSELKVELVALCGDELRTGLIQNKDYFTIYGDNEGETISFKLYDHNSKKLLDAELTYEFLVSETVDRGIINFVDERVFKITDQDGHDHYYAQLQNALNSDYDGIIEFIRNAKGTNVSIEKDATIDFNNFTYSFTEPTEGTFGITILDGSIVTLKNGILQVAEGSDDKYNVLVENCADQLVLDGMKLIGAGLDNGESSYVLSNNNGGTYIKNTTITANTSEGTHFAFDVCRTDYDVPGVILYDDATIIGKAELNQGNIFSDQRDLDIVAYKSFNAAPGEGTIGWGTISTPINGGSVISESLPETTTENPHDLYRYHEPTGMWHYYMEYPGGGASNGFDKFETGQGYLYANKEDITAKFEGKVNFATASMSVSYTEEAGEFKGFNLIGNPFASYITLDDITASGNISLVNSGFYSIDSETGGYIAKQSTDQISTMEAVMIQIEPASRANSFEAELIFTQPNPSDAKRSENVNASLAVSVSNDDYNDVAYVSFGEGLGLNKIEHLNNDVPMVYLPVDGENFAIATMSQDVTMIPVSFKAATMGEYTIAVEAQNCEYSTMTLVDRFTGVETNLLLEDYSFIAKSNDSADRFFIRLENSQQTTDNSNFAYIDNGMINIDVEGQAMINVYDVTGRSVAEYNVFESASISTSDFANGMYIIRMSDENGVKVQKVVIE